MAQVQLVAFNVYQINDNALATPQSFAFSASNIKVRPVVDTEVILGVTMNAIIQENAHGLQVDSVQYHVASTVAQVVTAFNS